MQIVLYQLAQDPRSYPKDLTDGSEITGTLRDATELHDPQIMIAGNVTANYCYIPQFGRYYYIQDITRERNGLTVLHCTVDAVGTFWSQILHAPCIIERASSGWNTYVADSRRKFFQYTRTQYITIKQNDLPGTNGNLGRPSVPILVTVG